MPNKAAKQRKQKRLKLNKELQGRRTANNTKNGKRKTKITRKIFHW